jgi:hypothetical protein
MFFWLFSVFCFPFSIFCFTMIRHLRERFNQKFTPQKYERFLGLLEERAGTRVKFRVSETPVFMPRPLLDKMAACGIELAGQLLSNSEYRRASDATIPFAFQVPNEDPQPLFLCADFGVVRAADGGLEPKLVEIQAFPSLYAFQVVLAQCYGEAYGLENVSFLLGNLDLPGYWDLLRRVILRQHKPENVVLLEIDPYEQKTLPDFLVTEKIFGLRIVNITEVARDKRQLYYTREGRRIPIHRIYNRAIVDELVRKKVRPAFSFRDELDVEWAGHPNWFFRISKFSIPHFKHECVPRTWFLHEVKELPPDLGNYVLKPLFSFAGLGVVVGPTREQIEAVPQAQRSQYILQQKMSFEPIIATPHGMTKAEVRIMYINDGEFKPVNVIIRMGRGAQMGVDFNRNMEWVGASAAFYGM